MKVKLLRDARVLFPAGTQVEIADEGARQLVSLGSAVEVKSKWETPEAPKAETPKEETPKVEKVERKPQKESKKG